MSNQPSWRILVVDDDLSVINALVRVLRDEGHTVVSANGGQAGINAFKSALESDDPFSAVITDLAMGTVDGRQVVAAVKQTSPMTPVILLTGWGEWFDAKAGVPLQVDQVLAKPPKLAELRAALNRLLKPEAC